MAKITYSWDEVEASRQKMEELVADTENLKAYPTPFQITKGELSESISDLGNTFNSTKLEMDNLVSAFSNFLMIAQISYQDVEAKMQESM